MFLHAKSIFWDSSGYGSISVRSSQGRGLVAEATLLGVGVSLHLSSLVETVQSIKTSIKQMTVKEARKQEKWLES